MVVLATNLISAYLPVGYTGSQGAGYTGSAGGPLADGDKGDITVSSSGTVFTIDNGAVTTAKLATLAPGVVISGTTTGDALRITQLGTGNALVVEDDTNPDATRFAVNSNGDVGIGVDPVTIGGGFANIRIGETNGGIINFVASASTTARVYNTAAGLAIEAGTNAGNYVRIRTGSTSTDRFKITDVGAWGLAGDNFGTTGQVITSNGTGSSPTWQTPSAGGGSAGQSIILSMIFGR